MKNLLIILFTFLICIGLVDFIHYRIYKKIDFIVTHANTEPKLNPNFMEEFIMAGYLALPFTNRCSNEIAFADGTKTYQYYGCDKFQRLLNRNSYTTRD